MPHTHLASVLELSKFILESEEVLNAPHVDFASLHQRLIKISQTERHYSEIVPVETKQLLLEQKAITDRLTYINANLRSSFLGMRIFESEEDQEEQDDLRGQKTLLEARLENLQTKIEAKAKEEELIAVIKQDIQTLLENCIQLADTLVEKNATQRVHIWQLITCWRMLNTVFGMLDSVEAKAECAASSKKIFKCLMQALPPEMQMLRVLFVLGDQSKIDEILNEYFALDPKNLDAYALFLQKFQQDINKICEKMAKDALLREGLMSDKPYLVLIDQPAAQMRDRLADVKATPETKNAAQDLANDSRIMDLPIDVQEKLLAQRACMIKLSAVLDLSDLAINDPLRMQITQYYQLLQNNIKNALINHRTIEKAEEDFARIQAGLMERETEIYNYIFKQKFYSATNAKIGAIMSGGLTTWWFMRGGGMANATLSIGLATATTAALHAIADEDAKKQTAAEMDSVFAGKKIDVSDQSYILELDRLWNVKSNKPLSEINVPDDGVKWGLVRVVKKAIFDPLTSLFSKLPLAIKVLLITLVCLAIILPIAFLIIIFPPIWPVVATIVAGVVVAGVAWLSGIFQTKTAQRVFNAARKTINVAISLLEYSTRPILDVVSNFRRGNYNVGLVKISMGIGLGVVGAVLVPMLLPAVTIATVVGGIVGVYLGLSVGTIIDKLYTNSTDAIQVVNGLDSVAKELKISLNDEQKHSLNKLATVYEKARITEFSETFLQHFKDRYAELLRKIELEKSKTIHDPDQVVKLRTEVDTLMSDWQQMLAALDTPQTFVDLLDKYLAQRWQIEREQFINAANARHEPTYKERVRKFMVFGSGHKSQPQQILGIDLPDFQLAYNKVDYNTERNKINRLVEMKLITDSLKQHYKTR